MERCLHCRGKTVETTGRFVKQPGQTFRVFTADERASTVRTFCPSCLRVLGYRPKDLRPAKPETYQ